MNLSTHKIIESAHVRIDKFVEKVEEEIKKEPKDYRGFVSFKSDTFLGIFDIKETSSIEPNIVTKSQEVQIESQGPKLQAEATKLMPTNFEGPETQTKQPKSQVEI